MAEGSPVRRIFAFSLLVLASGISFQAWQNGKITATTQAAAKAHACDLDASCVVLDERPRVGTANAIQHRYEFNTTMGMMLVTCQRELIFFGPWECTPEAGQLTHERL